VAAGTEFEIARSLAHGHLAAVAAMARTTQVRAFLPVERINGSADV
jgi:hypothetical protein